MKKQFVQYVFPLEGNFDIDAGDGAAGWGTKHRQTTQQITNKYFVRELFTLLGYFQKMYEHILYICIYTENATESDKSIENNNL